MSLLYIIVFPSSSSLSTSPFRCSLAVTVPATEEDGAAGFSSPPQPLCWLWH